MTEQVLPAWIYSKKWYRDLHEVTVSLLANLPQSVKGTSNCDELERLISGLGAYLKKHKLFRLTSPDSDAEGEHGARTTEWFENSPLPPMEIACQWQQGTITWQMACDVFKTAKKIVPPLPESVVRSAALVQECKSIADLLNLRLDESTWWNSPGSAVRKKLDRAAVTALKSAAEMLSALSKSDESQQWNSIIQSLSDTLQAAPSGERPSVGWPLGLFRRQSPSAFREAELSGDQVIADISPNLAALLIVEAAVRPVELGGDHASESQGILRSDGEIVGYIRDSMTVGSEQECYKTLRKLYTRGHMWNDTQAKNWLRKIFCGLITELSAHDWGPILPRINPGTFLPEVAGSELRMIDFQLVPPKQNNSTTYRRLINVSFGGSKSESQRACLKFEATPQVVQLQYAWDELPALDDDRAGAPVNALKKKWFDQLLDKDQSLQPPEEAVEELLNSAGGRDWLHALTVKAIETKDCAAISWLDWMTRHLKLTIYPEIDLATHQPYIITNLAEYPKAKPRRDREKQPGTIERVLRYAVTKEDAEFVCVEVQDPAVTQLVQAVRQAKLPQVVIASLERFDELWHQSPTGATATKEWIQSIHQSLLAIADSLLQKRDLSAPEAQREADEVLRTVRRAGKMLLPQEPMELLPREFTFQVGQDFCSGNSKEIVYSYRFNSTFHVRATQIQSFGIWTREYSGEAQAIVFAGPPPGSYNEFIEAFNVSELQQPFTSEIYKLLMQLPEAVVQENDGKYALEDLFYKMFMLLWPTNDNSNMQFQNSPLFHRFTDWFATTVKTFNVYQVIQPALNEMMVYGPGRWDAERCQQINLNNDPNANRIERVVRPLLVYSNGGSVREKAIVHVYA